MCSHSVKQFQKNLSKGSGCRRILIQRIRDFNSLNPLGKVLSRKSRFRCNWTFESISKDPDESISRIRGMVAFVNMITPETAKLLNDQLQAITNS